MGSAADIVKSLMKNDSIDIMLVISMRVNVNDMSRLIACLIL